VQHVGTPPITVHRSASIRPAPRGLEARQDGQAAAVPDEHVDTDDSPNTWKNGSTASTTSSLRTPNSPPATVLFMYSWKWVSSAPFGLPVVPLV
jgi:hypothetical protein